MLSVGDRGHKKIECFLTHSWQLVELLQKSGVNRLLRWLTHFGWKSKHLQILGDIVTLKYQHRMPAGHSMCPYPVHREREVTPVHEKFKALFQSELWPDLNLMYSSSSVQAFWQLLWKCNQSASSAIQLALTSLCRVLNWCIWGSPSTRQLTKCTHTKMFKLTKNKNCSCDPWLYCSELALKLWYNSYDKTFLVMTTACL